MMSFADLNLSPEILRAVTEMGFTTPSPIQEQALPILLNEPTDFLGLAGTGTGKTAAFGIPLLERIDSGVRAVQALILCPTRELANQVAGQINLLGKFKGVRSVAIYGGASYAEQIRGLRSGATIVVGTPGRVIDHIERGTLNLDNLKVLVLDEADEMFSMGFKDEIDKVLAAAPREESNIWLFSATMSRDVRRVADKFLRSPGKVEVNRKEMLSAGVEQYYYPTVEGNKPEIICKLIEAADDFYGLIFCQTKALVADLTVYLQERGYKVDCLHGDKDQNSRERTMQSFRDRKVSILICTDVASRGLDVKDITHVINYSLPRELDSYVHRIGRTARSGKTGIAMNLVTNSHRRLIGAIEDMTKSRMVEGRIPTRREIGSKKVSKILPRFLDQPFHTRALEIFGDDWKTQLATMTSEQVAAHFITMMMPEVFADREAKVPPVVPANSRVIAPVASMRRPMSAGPISSSRPMSTPMSAPVSLSAPKPSPKTESVAAKKAAKAEPVVTDLIEDATGEDLDLHVPTSSAPPIDLAALEVELAPELADAEEFVAKVSLKSPTKTSVKSEVKSAAPKAEFNKADFDKSEYVKRARAVKPMTGPRVSDEFAEKRKTRKIVAKPAPRRTSEERTARRMDQPVISKPSIASSKPVIAASQAASKVAPKAAAKPMVSPRADKPMAKARVHKPAGTWNPNSDHIPLISRKQRRLEKFGPATTDDRKTT